MKATTIEGREKKNPLPRGPNLECSSLLPFKKLWKESEEKKKKVPLELHIEKTLVTSLVHYTIQLGRPAYSLLACCSNSHRDPSINGVDFFSEFLTPPSTVCWIEVKVAVLCALQYMPWNLLLIKVLINFWYFKHQILTGTCSEAYL